MRSWMRLGALCVLVLPVGMHAGSSASTATAEQSNAKPCSTPEHRQFDFWVGDWEVIDLDNNTKDSHVRVELILDSCVLHEQYDAVNGHRGESFSIYDATRHLWHQSWVTNQGSMLEIAGNLDGGAMVLSGTDHTDNGKERQVRGMWKPVGGGVQETAVRSVDGGKTWQPWFNLMFRPSSSETGSSVLNSEVRKTIAALDTEYQAAVKKNDTATMERFLADDFMLVTGSGKTYGKADLLEEARSGRIVYEHQEDSEQTVRVWGDTAVLTAKLWLKGTDNGKPFDHTAWFSDTYAKTSRGWRYVFGQSSLPLDKNAQP
jgi:ketosteroid isomerase-like protein